MVWKRLQEAYAREYEAAKACHRIEDLAAEKGENPKKLCAAKTQAGIGLSRFRRFLGVFTDPDRFLRNLHLVDIGAAAAEAAPGPMPADVDTLRLKIRKLDRKGHDGFHSLLEQAITVSESDPLLAYSQVKRTLFESRPSQEEFGEGLTILAALSKECGDDNRAAWLVSIAQPIFVRSESHKWATFANRSAQILFEIGRAEIAVQALSRAADIFLSLGQFPDFCKTLLKTSTIEYLAARFGRSLYAARISRPGLEGLSSVYTLSCDHLIASNLIALGRAHDASQLVVDISDRVPGEKRRLRAMVDMMLGEYGIAMRQFELAQHHLEAALRVLREFNRYDFCLCGLNLLRTKISQRRSAAELAGLTRELETSIEALQGDIPMLRAAKTHLARLRINQAIDLLRRARSRRTAKSSRITRSDR